MGLERFYVLNFYVKPVVFFKHYKIIVLSCSIIIIEHDLRNFNPKTIKVNEKVAEFYKSLGINKGT